MTQPQNSPDMSQYPSGYRWVSPEEWAKLKFRTRGHFNNILLELRKYGQDVYVDGAIEALMYITEQTWDVVRGKDKPIKPHPHFRPNEKYGADD